MALRWMTRFHCVPICCSPDSRVAMMYLDGTVAQPKYPLLRDAASGLWLVLQQHTAATFRHVRSHTGHPWNELVDTLAGRAARSQASIGMCSLERALQPFPAADGWRTPLAWAFLLDAREGLCTQFPALA
eukprot:9882871-Lingulodinium_polyedra.AAC.1